MQERAKEYNMGYQISERRRKGEISEAEEQKLIEAATLIIIQEYLNHNVFIKGFTDGLKDNK